MEEKPLHVQVGEALGWTRAHYRDEHGFGVPGHPCGDILLPDPEHLRWKGRAPEEMVIGADCTLIPRFDTDWSATGPLIERFKIDLHWGGQNLRWWAGERGGIMVVSDETPLAAVCNLILALHAAGKLPNA